MNIWVVYTKDTLGGEGCPPIAAFSSKELAQEYLETREPFWSDIEELELDNDPER